MSSGRIDKSRQHLINQLTEWKFRRKINQDPYLDGLLFSIQNNKNIENWVNFQPLQWLPTPINYFAENFARITRFIALIRNVLIFSPVAITWYAIGEATKAFQVFVETGGETTVNFLDFWQNGYGVLDEAWRISEVARVDVYLIVGVILLTFLVGTFQNLTISNQEKFNKRIEIERTNLSILIEQTLSKFKTPTTFSVSQDFSLILNKLQVITNEIMEQIQSQKEFNSRVKIFNQNLTNSNTNLKKFNDFVSNRNLTKLKKASKDLEKFISQFKKSKRK